jgi:tetratricopeptide (TPR) repeat protein
VGHDAEGNLIGAGGGEGCGKIGGLRSDEPTPLSDDATLPGVGTPDGDTGRDTGSGSGVDSVLEPGTRIGRYVVLDRLGAGGMGVVYAAYDPHLDRRVALKLLRRESEASEASRRLLREAQAMARLRHPNVVTVHDVDVVDDRVFIAMEFIEGRTLRHWLEEESPGWRRVVDVFAQAGRGLAAAHAADLVHRDFKPDNAMVDAGGRVAVMDFGLARAAGVATTEADRAPGPVSDTSTLSSTTGSLNSGALGDDLTLTGALLGTPAYMSPEQFAGEPTDPRSDQFSYCVALYQALYDAPPFSGDTPAALAFNVLGGKLREPRGRLDVPQRLFAVLQRGLATRPEDRYPSMDALLSDLEHDPSGRWRGFLLPGVAVLAGLGAIVTLGLREPETTLCTGAADKLAAVYGEARRGQIRDAFARTQTPYADHVANTALARLDAFSEQWIETRTDACEATQVRGEQSDALMDRRMTCLDERLAELASVVSVLAEADEEVARRGLDALEGLGPIESCSDVEWLTARVPPPTDPTVRYHVSELQASLARVTTLRLAGRTQDGLALAREVLDATESLDYPPIRAMAAARLAMLEDRDRDRAHAIEHFSMALEAAIVSGDDRVATGAALGLAGVLVEAPERRAEAGRLVDLAESFWRRRPSDARLHAKILKARAQWLREGERSDEALATLQEALEVLRTDETTTEHEYSVVLDGIAHVRQRLGHYDDAVATYHEVLDIDQRTVGEFHPRTAMTHNNLGAMEGVRGNHEQALAHHEKALAIRERLYGPEHPAIGSTLHNLSSTLSALGRHDEAEEYGRRYLELAKLHAEGNGRQVAQAAESLGTSLYNAGQPERALPYYREALAEYERVDPDHTSTQIARYNLGEALELVGDPEEAMRLHRVAYEGLASTLGAEHPYAAFPLAGIGRLQLAGGDPREAVQSLERVISIHESGEGDPKEAARARFDLARALDALGDTERATTLATQARDALRAASGDHAERIAEIERWLSERQD